MVDRDRTVDEECCGNCNYCIPDDEGQWSCNNENSEVYGCMTAYSDCCDCHERYES